MCLYRISIITHLVSALVLLCTSFYHHETHAKFVKNIDWPREFEGKTLIELELSPSELRFIKGFPGQIAKFTDGNRNLLYRTVERETRMLHPVSDCLKASGYKVAPLPIKVGPQGAYWGCVKATKKQERRRVCERIYDKIGNNYSDISSWYWAAILNKTQGPWVALTIFEQL